MNARATPSRARGVGEFTSKSRSSDCRRCNYFLDHGNQFLSESSGLRSARKVAIRKVDEGLDILQTRFALPFTVNEWRELPPPHRLIATRGLPLAPTADCE